MRKFILPVLLLVMCAIGLSAVAQDATPVPEPTAIPTTPILLGQPINVTVTQPVEAGLVRYELTLASPTFVTITIRTTDATNPAFRLIDPYGRELIIIDDNPASIAAIDPKDAVYDNTLLLEGTYLLDVVRVDDAVEGTGALTVLVEEAQPEMIGIGQISVYDVSFAEGESIQVPVLLEQGDVVSFAALGVSEGLDLRLNLRDANGVRVLTNDDNSTFDLFLATTDPRIYKFIVPETQTYTLIARPFSGALSGDVRLVVQRHGRIVGEAASDYLMGSLENRERTALTVDLQANEVVRLTARANSESLDTEITLLDPQSIILGVNDDHSTDATDLGRFDARLDNLFINASGTYEIDVTSVSGRGEFEVEVTRLGVFEPATEPLVIDPATIILATPEPSPTEASPEVTAEPTASN